MHVSADLSAYLDEELAPAERARVSVHLDACGRCSAQLAELRATATMLAALPLTKPSRSLVPSLAPRWNWLRPMRSLSAVTSGAFLMVFLIASVAQSGSNLGGGPASPFGAGAAAPAAGTAAPQEAVPGMAPAELKVATESPVPAAAPAAAGASPAPTAADQERAADQAESTAFSTATGATDDAAARTADRAELQRQSYGLSGPPSPLIWLGLSLIAAALAFTAHWRLRAA